MRTWFYGFLELWTCTDMGLFGCLFACSCVGMSAYCLLTAPLVPQAPSPSSLGGREGKGVFILFVLLPFFQNVFDFTSQRRYHIRLA